MTRAGLLGGQRISERVASSCTGKTAASTMTETGEHGKRGRDASSKATTETEERGRDAGSWDAYQTDNLCMRDVNVTRPAQQRKQKNVDATQAAGTRIRPRHCVQVAEQRAVQLDI